MQYFKWEGVDTRSNKSRAGVIAAPGFGDPGRPVDKKTCDWVARELRRIYVDLVWWKVIEADEFHVKNIAGGLATRRALRIVGGAIGLAGCSAAAILLPMPVAIWAASAFAALTVSAAVPP